MNLSDPVGSLIPSLDGRVLSVLAGTTMPMNAALIARLAHPASVSGVRLVLRRLEGEGLVIREPGGRAAFVRANRDHLLWPAVETATGARSELERRIRNVVLEWTPPPTSTVLYGSVAAGTATTESDIDLLVVVEEAQGREADLAALIERWTGNSAHLLVLTPDELRAEARANPALARAWRQDGRTLQGELLAPLLDGTS